MSERISTEDVQEILNNPMQAFLRASIESTECLAADLLDARARIAELEARAPVVTGTGDGLRIIFDGPPGPEGGRFVEVETKDGRSVNAGMWRQRQDGMWELELFAALTAALAVAGTGDGLKCRVCKDTGKTNTGEWCLCCGAADALPPAPSKGGKQTVTTGTHLASPLNSTRFTNCCGVAVTAADSKCPVCAAIVEN